MKGIIAGMILGVVGVAILNRVSFGRKVLATDPG